MYTIVHTDIWSIFTFLAVLIQAIPAVVVLVLISQIAQEKWVR